MELGRFGIWWSGSWQAGSEPVEVVAAEMERLGYESLWLSGGFEAGLMPIFGHLLEATEHATVASGILSVWPNEPAAVAAEASALGPRFLLGIGASHAAIVEGMGGSYDRPYSRVEQFLDGLDGAGLGPDRRMLAALGPRMLKLAAERALGAHPYFVPLEHTQRARQLLGEGPLLAPEVAVVIDEDPGVARAAARNYATGYLGLPNYANNLVSLGWALDDVQSGGSDRLLDALIPWGSARAVAARLKEHLEVGADHVCIQVVRDRGHGFPIEEYRALAEELF